MKISLPSISKKDQSKILIQFVLVWVNKNTLQNCEPPGDGRKLL